MDGALARAEDPTIHPVREPRARVGGTQWPSRGPRTEAEISLSIIWSHPNAPLTETDGRTFLSNTYAIAHNAHL